MPSAPFDRRLTPARPDLAAEHLRGLVDAPRYAKGRRSGSSRRARRSGAPRMPDAPLETEALHGESVTVFDERRRLGLGAARSRPLRRLSAACARSRRRPSRRIGSRRCAPTPIPAPASSCRRAWRCRSARGSRSSATRAISPSPRTDCISGRAISPTLARASRTMSRSPSAFSRRPISGAAGRRRGSTARAWSRPRSPPPASPSPRDSDMQEAALGEPVAIDDPTRAHARRSRVLEGPCRHHARFRHAAARQRLAHEGRSASR